MSKSYPILCGLRRIDGCTVIKDVLATSLAQATAHSISDKIAFGPNAGKYVTRIGSGFGYGEEIPLAKGQCCYSLNGFTLHANTTTNTRQRDRLEKLVEYMARGHHSNERIEILQTNSGDKVKLKFKRKWTDDTTHPTQHGMLLIRNSLAIFRK